MADFGLLEYWEKTVVAPVTRLRDIYETTGRGSKLEFEKGSGWLKEENDDEKDERIRLKGRYLGSLAVKRKI
jgi:hypothetical protein